MKHAKVGFACVILMCAVVGAAQSQDAVKVERLYATRISGLNRIEAAPVHVRVQGKRLLILSSATGTIVALDPADGAEVWRVEMPTDSGERPLVLATPARVGKFLFVAYGARVDGVRGRQLVSVVDMATGEVAAQFPTLELRASKPANGGGVVVFNPPTALSRAALVTAGREPGTLGLLYVPFGNGSDIQPWHGWLFEIDIDAWLQAGADQAIRSVLLTTPEKDCPVEGESGGHDMICGAGLWHFAGPQVVRTAKSYVLLATTGNGELNLNDRNYSNSILRLTKGLDFDPQCDAEKCANFDPISPSEACMSSCKNISIPRLLPGDPPLPGPEGRCVGKSFLECVAMHDWDLGANGAVRIRAAPGKTVLVQPGKEGGLYLFDAKNMGVLYDRDQLTDFCGTPDDKCISRVAGSIRALPLVTTVDGQKVVIVPTFMRDQTHPAGVVARKIVLDDDGRPHFEPLWQAPSFDSDEARERFRLQPTLAFLTRSPDREAYVWLVDRSGGPDTLFGIRAADGTIVVRQPLEGNVETAWPGHAGNVIFVPSEPAGGGVVLEAFRIQY